MTRCSVGLAALLTVAGLAIAADPPAKPKPRVKELVVSVAGTTRVTGVVEKVSDAEMVVVEVGRLGDDAKEYTVLPINVLRDGKVLPRIWGMFAYRWADVQRGDTVLLEVKEDPADKQSYCMKICITRRPGAKLPKSQKPDEDHRYSVDRLYNDIDNGEDVSDEDIKKLFPAIPARDVGCGITTPAVPGGLPKEWQVKLDAIRAKKQEKELKTVPPEKK